MRDTELKIDGKGLERAIENIERQVLNEISQKEIALVSIETNKLINDNGVRHEIDIYVKVDLKIGTDLIYIFECKDYHKSNRSISKNDIIIFAEKVDVVGAQKGYFVASKYGIDSENLAKRKERIELLKFESDFDVTKEDFHFMGSKTLKKVLPRLITYPFEEVIGDVSNVSIKGDQDSFPEETVEKHLIKLLDCIAQSREPSIENADVQLISNQEFQKVYSVCFKNCFYDDRRFESLLIIVQVELSLAPVELMLYYDIDSRGRYIKQRFRNFYNNGYLTMELTAVSPEKYSLNIVDF